MNVYGKIPFPTAPQKAQTDACGQIRAKIVCECKATQTIINSLQGETTTAGEVEVLKSAAASFCLTEGVKGSDRHKTNVEKWSCNFTGTGKLAISKMLAGQTLTNFLSLGKAPNLDKKPQEACLFAHRG